MKLRSLPQLTLSQAQRRYVREQRAEYWAQRFRALVTRCDYCGREAIDPEVHEIPRGAYRLDARGKYFCCLLLCGKFQPCHAAMGGMRREKQLAYLFHRRPGHLRMYWFNKLFRPMVDEADVMREVKELTR